MLHLNNISLYQFKNYRQGSFHFNNKVIGILGSNGIGKTNLLDAIYYLCFTRSYFAKSDNNTVHKGLEGMRLDGTFIKNEIPEKITCIIRENGKKELIRNGNAYKKFSQHIGHFPAVIIAPDDVDLILGTSEVRRKFIDTILCQLNEKYLIQLIDYNKVLQQRNSLLKAALERNYLDSSLLDILDAQLISAGNYIYSIRKNFLNKFLKTAATGYREIAGEIEPVGLSYYSQLHNATFENLLQTFRQKDLMLQRSTVGIHKDDIEITLLEESFKAIASQGQRKSLLFALKLAEYEELQNNKGFAPLLLLDDVFEKLDEVRMENLLLHVCTQEGGQVFITDTHKDRLKLALANINTDAQFIEL